LVGAQFFLTGALLCFALVVHLQQRELVRYAHDSVPHPIVAIRNDLKRSGVELEVLRTELLRQPHVESVSAIGFTPWGRSYSLSALAASHDAGATDVTMMVHNVDHRYLNDLGFGALAGRGFDPNRANAVAGTQAPPSIILDRTAARQLGYDSPAEAVGKLIYPNASIRAARPDVSLRVIGVVDDKMMQFTTSGASGNAYLYDAKARVPLIRLRNGGVAEGLSEVQQVWRSLAPNFVLRATSIDETIQSYAEEKAAYVRALNVVTAMALVVALSGLVGMSIHMANRRRHEIGVRKTLGARTAQLVALLLRDFSRPVVIGSVAAWPLAYYVSRTHLNVYAHRIDLSITPFIASTVGVLAIACIAVSWHTAHAARMKPADVLRHE
jgi:putative ABC transport system permease protein